jgi:hypothetical protein
MNTLLLTLLSVVEWVAALAILVEAFNKLERTDLWVGQTRTLRSLLWLLKPWRWSRLRVLQAMKLGAWSFMAIGAAGVLVNPLLSRPMHPAQLHEAAIVVGFALLIVRSRMKEG